MILFISVSITPPIKLERKFENTNNIFEAQYYLSIRISVMSMLNYFFKSTKIMIHVLQQISAEV